MFNLPPMNQDSVCLYHFKYHFDQARNPNAVPARKSWVDRHWLPERGAVQSSSSPWGVHGAGWSKRYLLRDVTQCNVLAGRYFRLTFNQPVMGMFSNRRDAPGCSKPIQGLDYPNSFSIPV
jgi:hypothetical protein